MRTLALWLRRLADHIDPPPQTNLTFTFTNNASAPQRYGTWTNNTNAAANPLPIMWKRL
jgi:hypothetical protein